MNSTHRGDICTLRSTELAASRRRIILFPLPYQGHLSPMLQLASILHSYGFNITIIHPQQTTPNYSNYPHFTFKPIEDRFSEIKTHMPKKPEASFFLTYLNHNCVDSFRECMAGVMADHQDQPVACLITDAEYYFTQEVADSMNVPRVVFWACNIACVLVYADLPSFNERGYFNLTAKGLFFPIYPTIRTN